MAMADQLRIHYEGGATHEVSIKPYDLVVFERRFKMAASAMESDPRVEYVTFLAHSALVRTGRDVNADYDEWIKTVEEISEVTAPLEPPKSSLAASLP